MAERRALLACLLINIAALVLTLIIYALSRTGHYLGDQYPALIAAWFALGAVALLTAVAVTVIAARTDPSHPQGAFAQPPLPFLAILAVLLLGAVVAQQTVSCSLGNAVRQDDHYVLLYHRTVLRVISVGEYLRYQACSLSEFSFYALLALTISTGVVATIANSRHASAANEHDASPVDAKV